MANVETLGAFDTIDGGAGTDSVSLGATTKAITMGAGNDTVTVTANFGTGGTVDAGDGTGDTIKMTEALAANDSLSASSTFAGKISGFEKLSLTTVTGSKTVNLANLDAISFVTTTAATALTLDNMLSGGTVQLTAAANAVTTNVKDAALGGHVTDVINLKLYAATSGANVDYGTFTAANVETVNIESTRSGTIVTADTNEIDLTLANVKTLNITGSVLADLDGAALTAASLETIDGIAITGSATKANTIVGGSGADTITVGAGADNVTGGTGIDTIDLGAGVAGDNLNYGAAGTLIATNRDVITNFTAGATLADTITITAATVSNTALTPAGATAASEFVSTTVALTNGAATYDVSGQFDADAAFVLEIHTDLSSNGDLSLTTAAGLNGTELLKALSSTSATSITIAETTATADTGIYMVAYQNGNAYLYFAVDDNDDNALVASEISLIATFTGVADNAFTADNFLA